MPSTATPSRPRAGLPSTPRVGWVRTRYELRAFFRERDAIVFIFAYPVLMLLIFGTVFTGDVDLPGGSSIPFAQYFLPGMVATGLMLTSFQSTAILIATERDEGALKRLRATPLPVTAYFLGKTGLVLVTAVVQTVLLLVVAAVVFGVSLPADVTAWGTFAWVFVLSVATGTICGVGASSLPRSAKSASPVITSIVLVLQFVSGVFFAFYTLPSWLQNVASVFPLRWMAQGMRSVFLPEDAAELEVTGTWQHPMIAAVLAVWLVVGLVLATRTFRWQRRGDG